MHFIVVVRLSVTAVYQTMIVLPCWSPGCGRNKFHLHSVNSFIFWLWWISDLSLFIWKNRSLILPVKPFPRDERDGVKAFGSLVSHWRSPDIHGCSFTMSRMLSSCMITLTLVFNLDIAYGVEIRAQGDIRPISARGDGNKTTDQPRHTSFPFDFIACDTGGKVLVHITLPDCTTTMSKSL